MRWWRWRGSWSWSWADLVALSSLDFSSLLLLHFLTLAHPFLALVLILKRERGSEWNKRMSGAKAQQLKNISFMCWHVGHTSEWKTAHSPLILLSLWNDRQSAGYGGTLRQLPDFEKLIWRVGFWHWGQSLCPIDKLSLMKRLGTMISIPRRTFSQCWLSLTSVDFGWLEGCKTIERWIWRPCPSRES
jgi:hypothetical protein